MLSNNNNKSFGFLTCSVQELPCLSITLCVYRLDFRSYVVDLSVDDHLSTVGALSLTLL